MAVPANIYVRDTEVVSSPIEGVSVNVYNPSTMAFVAGDTTDVYGLAALLLPGAIYEVRAFKYGVQFENPFRIEVLEPEVPATPNGFNLVGTLQTLPLAIDPRCCRCTGTFVNYSNRPYANALVRLAALADLNQKAPKVIDGKMVAPSSMEFRTDSNGKVSFDLLRGGSYYLTFAGEDDETWCITVPDRASINLIDLIHPQPVSLVWDSDVAPGNAITLTLGSESTPVPVGVLFSDFQTRYDNLNVWVDFMNSDGEVVELGFSNAEHLVILAPLSAGTAEISATLKSNLTPIRVPDYSLDGPNLIVTVSP